MPTAMLPLDFVDKWRKTTLTERASAQSHFIDLCALLGQPTPTDADPTGESYTFEKAVAKLGGGQGFADVWRRGYFAWEYKRPGSSLEAAYQQLQLYREALENPPLLVVSDIATIQIHTNFTNTVKQVHALSLDDLLDARKLELLRAVFTDPIALRTGPTTQEVTEAAAREFAQLSARLRAQGVAPDRAAHFLIRLLFILFSEDIGLLPDVVFTRLLEGTRNNPPAFAQQLRQLLSAMRTGGSLLWLQIPYFNGGLFDDDDVIELDRESLDILARVSRLDWSSIEPAILGTLFERSLDPAKRAQLGAHYTSREDILLIVEPVLMAPLRRRWEEVQREATELVQRRDAATTPQQRTRLNNQLSSLLLGFSEEIAGVRVLDPACGSGNFLYVALRQLLDLEKEVVIFAGEVGLTRFFPSVSPEQLRGIEKDPYAHELAQATVWIGYIQWLRENGFGQPSEPILKPLDNIRQMDSILGYDAEGRPCESEWPEADVIIGNPPFLGGSKLWRELGRKYQEDLWRLYAGRVPAGADLVTYWYERSRELIRAGRAQRVGLLATNSIRHGANRQVLETIKRSGDIFLAWRDRPWVLDGAAVRVAMVGFDNGSETVRMLDGISVASINPDLTSTTDFTAARQLHENAGICFRGDTKGGSFDITSSQAQRMLSAPLNPNGRPNSDVVIPWVNGLDITRRPRNMWIIDFGIDMKEEDAALYELPYEYVLRTVKPERLASNRSAYRDRWWIHMEARPGLRAAIAKCRRYIGTPAVARHRTFVWLYHPTLPDQQLIVISRDDDYFLGVLHSKPHELWALQMGSRLGVGNDPRYTPTTTFETYPFPWPPGEEPEGDPRVEAIAAAARELVQKRDRWLNPEGVTDAELRKRTLTNLYNERPTWLAFAHEKLDRAVLDAYGWPYGLSNEERLERLLALNLERASVAGKVTIEPVGGDASAAK